MNKPYPYPVELPAYPNQMQASGGPFPSLSLQQIVRTMRRRLWTMMIVVLAIFSAVAYFTLTMTPIYRATATIIVDQGQNDVLDIGALMSGMTNAPGSLETELEVITSPVLLERVVRKLELHKQPEFNMRLREPTQFDQWKKGVSNFVGGIIPGGDDKAPEGLTRTLTDAEQADIDIKVATYSLAAKVKAARVGRTFLFNIFGASEDPEMAMRIANGVADQYLVDQLDAKFEAVKRANAWLDDRLKDLRDEVNDAERSVEEFRTLNQLETVDERTLTETQIGELSGQLIQQEASYSEKLARLNSVRQQISRGSSDTIAEVLNSDVVRTLRGQLAQVTRQRADLETRYGPRHPDLVSIIREQQDLEREIDAEVRRIVASLESEVAITRQRVEGLRAGLNNLRGKLSENNRALIRLRELERSRDASRTLYEAFLERFKVTEETESFTEADARILSYANTPRSPALPRTKVNMILGLVLGCVVAGALVLLMELLDNRVSSGEEVEERFGVPFLGNVPLLSGIAGARQSPPKYLVKHPMSAYAESMRNLRASVKFADIDKPAKLVTITSSFPNEGKTSLTLSLGRMSAMTGSKTLVIDGDFRRRQLTEIAGLKPQIGLIEHLLGNAELDEVIVRDSETELDILPLSKSGNTTRDVFGSKAFDTLMLKLKSEYDLIVIDTAPILLMAETRVIAAKSDQVVVSARWRRTNRGSLQQTLTILREFNASIAGVALTFVDLKRLNKHSGAALSNYKAYSKYYVNN